MARNTQVTADHNAPAVTQILAKFVASHPSKGWSDEVDLEAHRTFMNWLGCAVGATGHEAADAALAAVQVLQPAAQASVLGRATKVDMASAALLLRTTLAWQAPAGVDLQAHPVLGLVFLMLLTHQLAATLHIDPDLHLQIRGPCRRAEQRAHDCQTLISIQGLNPYEEHSLKSG